MYQLALHSFHDALDPSSPRGWAVRIATRANSSATTSPRPVSVADVHVSECTGANKAAPAPRVIQ